MGLAASQARYLHLTGSLAFVQRRGQMVNNERTAIANELNSLMNGNSNKVAKANPFLTGGGETSGYFGNIFSNSKEKKQNSNNTNKNQNSGSLSSLMSMLETAASSYPGARISPMQIDSAKLASLQSQDAKLEMILRVLDTQAKALQTEIGAVTKVIDKNIEGSFKLFA